MGGDFSSNPRDASRQSLRVGWGRVTVPCSFPSGTSGKPGSLIRHALLSPGPRLPHTKRRPRHRTLRRTTPPPTPSRSSQRYVRRTAWTTVADVSSVCFVEPFALAKHQRNVSFCGRVRRPDIHVEVPLIGPFALPDIFGAARIKLRCTH